MCAANRSTQDNSESIDGSALCLSCGLCCQGVFHNHVRLREDEIELAEQLELTLYPKVDYPAFRLPCHHYCNNRCSTYHMRPNRCGEYQCDLLKRYLNGEISLAEGITTVEKAKELIVHVYHLMGGRDPTMWLWKQIRHFSAQTTSQAEADAPTFVRAHARLLLAVKSLAIVCSYFDSHYFGHPDQCEDIEQ